MPKDTLAMAVHRLIGGIGTKVLEKRKLEDIDVIAVSNIPVYGDMYDRLRYGEWLNDDIINLEMSTSGPPYGAVDIFVPFHALPLYLYRYQHLFILTSLSPPTSLLT